MISAVAAARIVANLAALRLPPLDFLRVWAAIAPALVSGNDLPVRNGATPPAPKKPPAGGTFSRSSTPNGARKPAHSNKPATKPVNRSNSAVAAVKFDPEQHAVNFLRGCLSLGPKPASHVEELAQENGIGSAQLEAAKATLGAVSQRPDNGRGACMALRSHIEARQA